MSKQISLFQGASKATAIKTHHVGELASMRMAMNQGLWVKYGLKRFFMFDVYCGEGYNIVDNQEIIGTPLKLAEAAYNSNLVDLVGAVQLVCTDIRQDAINTLKPELQRYNREGLYLSASVKESSEQIHNICNWMTNEKKEGRYDFHAVIVLDPNGPKQLPLEEIRRLVDLHANKIDLILNINEVAFQRILGHKRGAGKNSYDWWICLMQEVDDFYKTISAGFKGMWVRRKVPGTNGWSMAVTFGYSVPKNDWSKEGFKLYKGIENE